MVDIQHTTNILENLVSQSGKATSKPTGAEQRESEALDSQFNSALDELKQESISTLDNALAEELVKESEYAELGHMGGGTDLDHDESFQLNYGIHGREGDQRQRGQQQHKDPEDEMYEEPIDASAHDAFELAAHAGGQYDYEVDSDGIITATNDLVSLTALKAQSDDPTVFDLVPLKKTDGKTSGEVLGEESWESEISLEEIFQETLGESETSEGSLTDTTATTDTLSSDVETEDLNHQEVAHNKNPNAEGEEDNHDRDNVA